MVEMISEILQVIGLVLLGVGHITQGLEIKELQHRLSQLHADDVGKKRRETDG